MSERTIFVHTFAYTFMLMVPILRFSSMTIVLYTFSLPSPLQDVHLSKTEVNLPTNDHTGRAGVPVLSSVQNFNYSGLILEPYRGARGRYLKEDRDCLGGKSLRGYQSTRNPNHGDRTRPYRSRVGVQGFRRVVLSTLGKLHWSPGIQSGRLDPGDTSTST